MMPKKRWPLWKFEAKARFLRQLLKNINRFVGQREFNDEAGQAKYMKKVSMYLEPLGWTDVSERDLFNAVPDDKTNMLANLLAIIRVLSPQADTELAPPDDDAPVTSVDAHTEPIPLNNELSASSADTDMNPITAIVQDLDNMVSEIIDPAFTSDNTAEDDTPYRKQINKFLEVLSNHDEEEKE